MRDGFVRVAAGTPEIRVGDVRGNADAIIKLIIEADKNKAKLLVLPEMCLVGVTAGDMILQRPIIDGARAALNDIISATADTDVLAVVGLPYEKDGRLYDCAAVLHGGELLGIVPKGELADYGPYSDSRWFEKGLPAQGDAFGTDLVFAAENMPGFDVSVSFPGERWGFSEGAAVVACPSAVSRSAGSADNRTMMARAQSSRLVCAIVCAEAGEGESTTDLVFSGDRVITENGRLIESSAPYTTGLTYADIDIEDINRENYRMHTRAYQGHRVNFRVRMDDISLSRTWEQLPFIPADPARRAQRCAEVLDIQARGLAARMKHIGSKKAVLAVSGGLDSTLALLVAARAFDILGLPHDGITAITMPGFGTTPRTRSNAEIISVRLGARFITVPIGPAVKLHFSDIGHDESLRDVTYENSQARERTQVLMDIANMQNGIAIGTGDLSELALGWATYNGDHMSMYAVNAAIPKTLVRRLVDYEADNTADAELSAALKDILATPVSPELLPPVDGEIAQKTEDLVGPYELHDFFIYHVVRRGRTPRKTLRLAVKSFEGVYSEDVIKGWLKVFCRRFFTQQFKRSCMPDGPRVGSVGLSPRGDLKMPSDAVSAMWNIE